MASTARYALNVTWDSDRSAAVLDHRDHRPLYRLSYSVTVETLVAHDTDGRGIYDGEREAWQPWGGGGGPGFALTYYRDILSRRRNAIPGATAALNYTLTWRMYNEAETLFLSLSFSCGSPSAEPDDPADRDERCIGKRRTMRLILSRISRELDRNAGRIYKPAIAMKRPYVRRSAHYTPLALLYYKVVSEWETKPGPLPAQPYILVLWATHIGRYAIKHSPSARARERASRAERL